MTKSHLLGQVVLFLTQILGHRLDAPLTNPGFKGFHRFLQNWHATCDLSSVIHLRSSPQQQQEHHGKAVLLPLLQKDLGCF